MGQKEPSDYRIEFELNLRLVNQEAREVVERRHMDFRSLTVNPSLVDRKEVMVNTTDDMLYFNFWTLVPLVSKLFQPIYEKQHIERHLRHLALPLLYVGRYPDPSSDDYDDITLEPEYSLWLAPDFLDWLAELPNLQTLYLVVNHLFSAPFGATGRRITRPPRASVTANTTVGPELVASRSKLRDLVASQPRDAYGFSDYDAFMANWQWPIEFPTLLKPYMPSPPSAQGAMLPLGYGNNHSGRSNGGAVVKMSFEEYDPFVKQVLSEVRRVLALTHPARVPNEGHGDRNRTIDVHLVVDLDSNTNGMDPFMKLGEDGHISVVGYDRHFCVEGCSVSEWYTNISGHDPSVKGFEDDAEAKRNESDPEFDAKDLDLDNLSDGSGPDSEYE